MAPQLALSLAAALLLAVAGGGAGAVGVEEAMSRSYVAGMSQALADQLLVDIQGSPPTMGLPDVLRALLDLLDDADYARPDNVLALLSYLGTDASLLAMEGWLGKQTPARIGASPAHERAFLIMPMCVANMRRRGLPGAWPLLSRMVEDSFAGLTPEAAGSKYQAMLRDQAWFGVANSGDDAGGLARKLFKDRAGGTAAAREAEKLFEGIANGTYIMGSDTRQTVVPNQRRRQRRQADTATTTDALLVSFCNHPDVAQPMTEARLDSVFREATLVANSSNFEGDVSCCIALRRDGAAATVGQSGDGLDVIDTSRELSLVLGSGCGRAKLVNVINFCGGPGTNILGCATIGGTGMVMVRLFDETTEGKLWLHEIGHQVSLVHDDDNPLAVMFPSLSGSAAENVGLTQGECDQFHSPAASADFAQVIISEQCLLQTNDIAPSGDDAGLGTAAIIGIVVALLALAVVALAAYTLLGGRRTGGSALGGKKAAARDLQLQPDPPVFILAGGRGHPDDGTFSHV